MATCHYRRGFQPLNVAQVWRFYGALRQCSGHYSESASVSAGSNPSVCFVHEVPAISVVTKPRKTTSKGTGLVASANSGLWQAGESMPDKTELVPSPQPDHG